MIGFGVLVSVWLLSWRWSHSEWQRTMALEADEDASQEETPASVAVASERDAREQCFREAQRMYLAGDWVATEQMLLKLLKEDARDVQARLMLATLWRRQGRLAEAVRQLDKLARLEAAEAWEHEIAGERYEIEAARNSVPLPMADRPPAQRDGEETLTEANGVAENDEKPTTNQTDRRLAA